MVFVMSNRKNVKNVLYHIGFWGIVALAVTAEGWMDLLCRFIYGA
jgi:hypothetical protein